MILLLNFSHKLVLSVDKHSTPGCELVLRAITVLAVPWHVS